MALIKTWLVQRLIANPGVYSIVGKNVYPIYAPQKLDPPFVTVSRAGTERNYVSNVKVGSDGYPAATIHVQCWDSDYDRLETLEDATRRAIDGARDPSLVTLLEIDDEMDIPEPLITGFEFPIYGVRFVLKISYAENSPNN